MFSANGALLKSAWGSRPRDLWTKKISALKARVINENESRLQRSPNNFNPIPWGDCPRLGLNQRFQR